MKTTTLKTLQVRVKDKHSKLLHQMAFEVNQVFNHVNELTGNAWSVTGEFGPQQKKWLSAFDVNKLIAGMQKERGFIIGSANCQEIASIHAQARNQFKKAKLQWRISGGSKRSLGWVPFRGAQVKWVNGCVKMLGHHFKVWDSYGLSKYKFRAGSFSEDSRGRWYFNVAVEVDVIATSSTHAVGVDLGLKDYATVSNGDKLVAAKFYREMEDKLGKAQRARKTKRVRAIHAKIKNRRKDTLHKFTTRLVNNAAAIFVGDVSSAKLARTKMAKSVYDAGWHMLKTQLKYKAIARSVVYEDVNEAYSTQACSCCGCISSSSPKGRAGLVIREWTCDECGVTHDRDTNAAMNILAAGLRRLEAGIPTR